MQTGLEKYVNMNYCQTPSHKNYSCATNAQQNYYSKLFKHFLERCNLSRLYHNFFLPISSCFYLCS